MKGKQGYIGGMNQDSAYNKRNPGTYYSAHNFRVVTEGGLSTGSLENEKGHVLGFTIPNTTEITLTSGTVIPAQSNLRIIGWTTVIDKIVVFTTNETAESPTTSYGQIWVFEFDESTGKVIGATADNELVQATHLVYNNQVNFSTYNRIGRAIGRYETTNIQRVYWTDNYNSVRTLNIADPNSLDADLENLDIKPGAYYSTPNIENIDVGNLPEGSMIQFSYKLLDSAGAETLYAPCSNLIPLPRVDLSVSPFQKFTGDGDGITPSKSVTYNIKGLDSSYNVIQNVAVLYTAPNVYTVYLFDEQKIPASGNVTVICSDLSEATIITNPEFNLLSAGFDKAKDIEVKSNRLIAANTKTVQFDIDFDARAYRFNSSRLALLEGDTNITLDGTAPDYASVPAEHNAINRYNQENNTTWATDQYKYQADGTTLGGSGANISYTFVTESMVGNTIIADPTQEPDHIGATLYPGSEPNKSHAVTDADNSSKGIVVGSQYNNFASQWAVTSFKGYARGEVYRFGIVFHNKKGSNSFVEWIGDVRFPDVSDGYPIQDVDGSGNPVLKSLGIQFTVDVSSIADKISGYSIVRVKRDENDKTKLGTGMLMFFDIHDRQYFHSLPHRWQTTGPDGSGENKDNPFEITDEFNLYGIVRDSSYHLSDKPGFNIPQLNAGAAKRVTYLLSPMGQLYDYQFKSGDYIDTTGYYESYPVIYGGTAKDDSPPSQNNRSYAFYYKCLDFASNPYSAERFEIGAAKVLEVGEFIYEDTDIIDGYTGVNGLRNASYCKDRNPENDESHVPLGLGSKKVALMLSGSPTINNNTGDPGNVPGNAGNMRYLGSNWTGPDSGGNDASTQDQFILDFDGGDSAEALTTMYFKEVRYARYNLNQYGGNTFADRSKNEYMSCGHYQVIEPLAATSFTSEVFGGDVFVNYYDDEQIQFFQNKDTAVKVPYKTPEVNKLSVAVCFPCESPVNTDYRTGRHWAADRSKENMDSYETNDWLYNQLWSQENTTETKYFAKDFLLNTIEEQPHQLWASETKLDGELIDRWRIFRIANATEVDGIHGPINRIINFKDRLYFYQDKAIGIASIDERSIINDASGQAITLGTGGVFPNIAYISTNTGTVHQFSVVASESALYHYDARLKKLFSYSGQGSQPISDIKGLSSFFDNAVLGNIVKKDKTLSELNEGAIGVHGIADFRYNRVLFTFLNTKPAPDISNYYDSSNNAYTFPAGSLVFFEGLIYTADIGLSIDAGTPPKTPDISNGTLYPGFRTLTQTELGFTVSYNEFLQAFESFYDYVPNIYLQYGRRLISASPFAKNKGYVHNQGDYGKYYDQAPVDSKLNTIFGDNGDITKIFNNLEYKAELYDSSGNDIFNETFNSVRIYNEYQDTGVQTLTVEDNIKRRMRTWRYTIPRENNGSNARIRNPWTQCELVFTNNNNKRHVVHEIIYSYMPAQM